MEACFADKQFKARHSLGSVNSVNVVRLIVQTVHYFYAYLRATPPGATAAVEFAVPCGAAGHLSAGLLAVEMGLPARLVAATNANDALHRLLSSGELRPGAAVRRTVSPSMDIQVPYNCWRRCTPRPGADARAVRRWQADFRSGAPRAAARACAGGSRRACARRPWTTTSAPHDAAVHAAGAPAASTRTRPSASPPRGAIGLRRHDSVHGVRAPGREFGARRRARARRRRRRRTARRAHARAPPRTAASRPSPRWRAPHAGATRPASTRRPAAIGGPPQRRRLGARPQGVDREVERGAGVAAVTSKSLAS